MRTVRLAASILASNLGQLEEEVKRIEAAQVDAIHIDVMDGHFVPYFAFGADTVQAVRKITRLPVEVHLMIQQPDRYARAFVEAGADLLIVHLEAYHDPRRTIARIQEMGCRCSLAINPMTLVENTYSLLKKVDQLLCMSVNPGFMGQPFIIEVLEKVRIARAYRDKNHLHFDISIDGGVTDETIGPCVTAGANQVVVGGPLFIPKEAKEAAHLLRARANEVGAGG
ncbi:MAG TPA: ribulose-phosphate 3-epimerase [Candidatus Methylacidiphilales bacterium]|nr:ribulose-phosphate 3-epimerase [Candidatus Methylacidiphilales bacterium]